MTKRANVQTLIPAAGMGTRLGFDKPKALVELAGRPLLIHTIDRFVQYGFASGVVTVVPPGHEGEFQRVVNRYYPNLSVDIVPGGMERQVSVHRGLLSLSAETEFVIIHDAARPFVSHDAIHSALDAARTFGAATVAIPCVDTILEADDQGFLERTPDRARLWACQTPQVFRVDIILEAHDAAAADGDVATDDATLVRRYGNRVRIVQGSPMNRKITTPQDLAYAEHVIASHDFGDDSG